MKLASIEIVKAIIPHENADALEFCQILGYRSIVRKEDKFQIGEKVIFIFPDAILPDTEWSKVFRAKSNRTKAIKLRGEWSEGITLKINQFSFSNSFNEGDDVTELLQIRKYEAPEPQDLQAKGCLPFGLPITDEENYQKVINIPYGEVVDVTLKRDGKSWSAYVIHKEEVWHTGICGRCLEYKLDCSNDYTKFKNILEPLKKFAIENDASLVIRGEITGDGIQSFKNNPHAVGEKELSVFSIYLVDERRYAGKGEKFYFKNVANALGIKTVEFIEEDVILTPELIKKYAEDLTKLNNKPFEGVVIKGQNFSMKVINKTYDSLK